MTAFFKWDCDAQLSMDILVGPRYHSVIVWAISGALVYNNTFDAAFSCVHFCT